MVNYFCQIPNASTSYEPEVQQRGISATRSILLQLMDGMGLGSPYEPLLVVDLLPSRFLSLLYDALQFFLQVVCCNLALCTSSLPSPNLINAGKPTKI